MKITTEMETFECDFCHKARSNYMGACLLCGKHICYGCQKTCAVEYYHAVYFSGYGDGLYCHPCDRMLSIEGKDKLYMTYRKIRALRDERQRVDADFECRAKEVEAQLAKLKK